MFDPDSRAATRSLTAAAGPVTREDSGDSEMLVVTEEVGLADAERWNAIAQILNTKLEQVVALILSAVLALHFYVVSFHVISYVNFVHRWH